MSPGGEAAGHHPAEDVPHDRHLALAPGGDVLEAALEGLGALVDAPDVGADARAVGPEAQQAMLLANCLAQAEALMIGSTAVEPWRVFEGNRPSALILLETLEPESLGALIALYEHKTFVEGAILGINSFDQWGVELGKTLALRILGELQGGEALEHDPSTASMIARLKQQ